MDSQSQEKIVSNVETWEQTFQELMQEVKPRAKWTLKLDKNIQPDCVAQGWKQYQQRAFGRFRCSSCKRFWASAQVQILCHMYLEIRKSQGQVLMRLFAQRCRRCTQSQFEKPEFSPESTMRILKNLVRRIQERYYGDGIRKFSEMPVVPEVPLEGSHDTANCEACTLGFCVWGFQNCIINPPESPLSYREIGSSSPHTGDMSSQNQAGNQSGKAREAQGSGYSCVPKKSTPSHATAGTQVPGAGPQPKQETGRQPTPGANQQAKRGTGLQPSQVEGSLPLGRTDPQPTRAVVPLPSGQADSQSTPGGGPQAPRRAYSQVLRCSGQQITQKACSQATQGVGLQATRRTDLQPTQKEDPIVTRRSRTLNETQDAQRRQEKYSDRRPAPDSFFGRSSFNQPNNTLNQDNIFMKACVCIAAVCTFLMSKYFS